MGRPFFSIVTVCYNAKAVIEKTILSVINQTYTNFEYIIVDGGSSDGTLGVINKYKNNISVLISEPDNGVYDAMNKGIMRANGQWINFMNAGDTFASSQVLFELSKIDKDLLNDYDVIFGDCIVCISLGEKYSPVTKPFWKDNSIIPNKGFSHQSVFVKTDIAKSMPFNIKYKICADFGMMFRLYNQGHKFLYKNFAISKYEVENGLSKRNALLVIKENALIVGAYGKFSFKCYYAYMYVKNKFHKAISILIKNICPSLFNYIKLRRL